MAERALCVVMCHHKGGSESLLGATSEIARRANLSLAVEHLPQTLPFDCHMRSPFLQQCRAVLERTANGGADIIFHRNADPVFLEAALASRSAVRTVHIVRDPRDMIVSGYFSHRDSHRVTLGDNPWMALHRVNLQRVDLEAGLLAELDYQVYSLRGMAALADRWPETPRIKLEELAGDPASAWRRLFRGLDLEELVASDPAWFGGLLERQAFDVLSAARPDHYRSGKSGRWRALFTPRVTARFELLFGSLPARLGYV